ncbi:MAG TPA: isoprenylcysteine carboxylmethyltransferase family protein [Candidatus Udaeobacter sp.]|jgi:protein-S-isoprenylcysteine O-methyltransferase Ste14|nr:isoprenylcysteine carboxylmethyltransferase family protein [Candidatus Udaeobacter sp.]
MSGSSLALHFIGACWLVFVAVWLLASVRTKRTIYRESTGERLRYWFLLVIAYVLLTQGRRFPYPLSLLLVPQTAFSMWIGAILCGCGLALAIWARTVLGRNWSGVVTLKEDHEMVQWGPYRFVRHPIYTGLQSMFLGTAIAFGHLAAFLGVALVFVSFWIKLNQEERLMLKQFPNDYPEYQRRVKRIIPFLL